MNQHGSCGVGFGTTVERTERHYNLFAQDLRYPSILRAKLENIASYYHFHAKPDWEMRKQRFFEDVQFLLDHALICQPNFKGYDQIIFEGAQGILLDMDFGFFPNVTRSNCTSKNALELIREFDLPFPRVYYVHRAYQTRHGIGFMTNEGLAPQLVNKAQETNVRNSWQGEFRKGMLDVDLMQYALQCDARFHETCFRTLVLTCVDQVGATFPGTARGQVVEFTPNSLFDYLTELSALLVSEGPETTQMYQR